MLADDSGPLRRRLAALLERFPNIQVVGEAEDVDQAIDSVDRLHPDLVVVDLHMPGSGLSLIEYLAGRPARPTLVVLTNYASRQYRDHCLHAGADYFYDKSTEFEAAVQTLGNLSQTRRPEGSPEDHPDGGPVQT